MRHIEDATGRARRRLPILGKPHAGPVLALIMFTASAMFATSSGALARSAPDSFADVAKEVLPAVVNISTVQKAKVRFMSNEGVGPEHVAHHAERPGCHCHRKCSPFGRTSTGLS